MKRYIKTIALALAVAATGTFTSCSEDDIYEVDINNVPMASDYADCVDITVDQNTNYATFTFTGKGVYPVWIIDGKSYSTNHSFSRYYRKAGDYSVELKVGNGNGISNGTITKSFTIDKTMMSGFGGFVYDSPFNLWTAATKQINSFFYAPGWTQLPDPEHSFDGETFSVVFPEATTEQWQNQIHIGTDICLNEGESFDGSFIFTSTMDMKNVTLKIHPDGDDDDGEGFIDLGLDNIFEFDGGGGLKGVYDGTWLAINGQPVAYYHTSTVDDGTDYAITGRVPVLHNGQRGELILVFDSETPYGYVAGVQAVYRDGKTDTVAKSQEGLQPGDRLEFLCDYYSYGGDYQDSYLLGDPVTVGQEELTIHNVPLEGAVQASYRFTDLYHQYHWTPPVPSAQ